LKLFRKMPRVMRSGCFAVISAMAAAVFLASAWGELPSWIRNVEARSALESVFFRAMDVPGGEVLHRRPPSETRPALQSLITQQPKDAELYSLLALEDEQQLDFTAAEADWKRFVDASADKTNAELAIADFYHRRLRPQDELKVLSEVANAPAKESEKLTPPAGQQSWQAFERVFTLIQQQGMPKEVSIAQYRSWIARYPNEPSVYSRFLDFLISTKDYDAANQLVEDYKKQFPKDEIFAVKAKALIEYRRGSLPQGLEVYEKTFQPLWDPELVKSYFDLLGQTQSLRKFLDEQRAALTANPEDLRATALVFYYYQQEGKLDAAQAEITRFRMHKESAHSQWTSNELSVCGRLLEEIHAYPEAARYYFALYNVKEGSDAQERALSGLARVLLEAPETPIRFGAGDLSMYRDIATMDQGPGYLNGILSLILNTTDPASEFSQEEQRAVPYFHRASAAKLLALLDTKFPNSPDRPELHVKLLEYYAGAGESDAVIRAGKEFLGDFPVASQRTQVSLLMADAYARKGATQEEFAIYDSVLKELAAKAQNVPLGSGAAGMEGRYGMGAANAPSENYEDEGSESGDGGANEDNGSEQRGANAAFQVQPRSIPSGQTGPRSAEYARVLERYLARLAELKQIPQAITVLRNEIERNPDDPGLYERLAVFLEQNRLGAEQEEVYKRAMARFPDRSWYSKLARLYLRHRQTEEFTALTEEVVKLFTGTDLESYFQSVVYSGSISTQAGPALYVQLNLYAHQRFPHNPVFVNNLLMAYQWPQTRDQAAWVQLLRQHWFEEANLRNQFFAYLSASGQLESDLQSLRQELQAKGDAAGFVKENPAGGEYLAEANLWRSHYEESAPLLKELAAEYPADPELSRTASSVFRSLAYFQPADTDAAVKIEENLLAANPGNTDLLARIGDTLADRELFARAARYWDRIPQVSPGESNGYLDAASIYWDYFDFDNALRLLNEARKKFGDDSLYAYEEGAIYEGKREYPQAIEEYVKGSLSAGAGSPAENRLLQLAQRPKYRDLVETATKNIAESPGASLAAISLRARVLETLKRNTDLEGLLEQAVNRATTLEQATDLGSLAGQNGLESVLEHALEKQASLTSDPVTRLQLRYQLEGLYEKRKDFADAQRTIEELYQENPKILGVVRTTVDFDWRSKLYPQAIAVLQQAAKDAYPELSRQFIFEAARKSTEAKLYPQARTMLATLLKDSPYDAEYLAAMADTYAKAGDQQGLKQFYMDEIAAFRAAPLNSDAKKAQIAVLRRGLIPALTNLHDYSGAVDRYVELINAFPEDEGLASEAALYAARNHLQQRVVDFYAKTVQQSPHDYRWAMVLARVQTALEDYPAAIDAYGKAIAIRPDRVDLRSARAGLAERLMRFDDAAADYEKIYELAYKDPQWMEKIAEIRARQGRTNDAVAALKTALIDGTPERPDKYFDVARRLEAWGMLAQARAFAEQGLSVAGAELLASAENHSGAALYAQIMTRLRQQDAAYARLQEAMSAASSSLPVIEQQVARQGISAVTNSDWRRRVQEEREQNARIGMKAALTEMGATVAAYFTPEEKVAFAQFAQKVRAPMSPGDVEFFAIPLVQAAGLEDLEANWRYALMMTPTASVQEQLGRMRSYMELQRRRLKFEEYAPQLEDFAMRIPPVTRPSVLLDAARAYRSAGDLQNELRVLSEVWPGYMGSNQLNRYCELLLQRQPQQLVLLASNWTPWGEQAADYAIANGTPELAHEVVAGRSRVRVPVWKNAYDALTGLYFAEATPAVNKSFVDALGDETIGERMGKKLDRNLELAGDIWFYYGSRYGEYLGTTKQGDPEDFLPAVLEQSPASSAGYLQVADYYEESGNTRAAIADYFHVLELNPGSVTAHDRLALAYLKEGDRAQAIKHWELAIALLAKQVDQVTVPEGFWTDFALVCKHSGSHHLFAELKPDVDALLRAYLKKNGTYRSNELLKSAFEALRDPAAATEWLLDLSAGAQDPIAVLADVENAPWIPLALRAPIYQKILAAKHDAVEKAEGLEKESAQDDLRSWQLRWASYLVQTEQFGTANDFVNSLPQETLTVDAAQFTPIQLQVAAHLGTLDAMLAGYRADEEHAPTADVLRAAAKQLQKTGDEKSAHKILEFVFTREIDERHLEAANFLGLAEIRIADGDLPGAIDLLRRLTVVVGNPFENLDSAAALLEKTGHNAEAVEFLEQLVKATPWNSSFALRLAKAKIAAGMDAGAARETLAKITSDVVNSYGIRSEAALAMQGQAVSTDLGSKELNLLAAGPGKITPAVADQPYFYAARVAAAKNTADAHAKIQLLSNAVADSPAREAARIDLFEAAAAAHSDELALAALEGTVRPQILARYQAAQENTEEAAPQYENQSGNEEQQTNEQLGTKLTPERQAQIAFEAAEVLVRLERLNEGLTYFAAARRLEKNSQRRKLTLERITAVKKELARQQLNQARQPILHEALEQNRLVRPRIPVATAATLGKGVAQP
jgi:cellulose synthase operon protein C